MRLNRPSTPFFHPFLLALLAASPVLATLACGSSDASPGETSPADAGTDANPVSLAPQWPPSPALDDASTDSALPPSTTLVSNTPGVAVVDESQPPAPNLVLVSSNLTQTPSGEEILLEWFGAVKNVGTTPVCNLTVRGRFEDSRGYLIVSPALTRVDAAPYATAAGAAALEPCLGAGETAGFYSGGLDLTEIPIASFGRIGTSFAFTSPATGEGPAPDAPTVTAKVTSVQGGDAVTGTLTGGGGAVSGVKLTFYPMNADGLVLGRLVATDPDPLTDGGACSFATAAFATPFTTYLQSESFTVIPEDAGADAEDGGGADADAGATANTDAGGNDDTDAGATKDVDAGAGEDAGADTGSNVRADASADAARDVDAAK